MFLFVLVTIGCLIMFAPPIDPDFGWHYKYGEYFWQHGKLLQDNIFSYTMPEYKWNNSYWLFDAIAYFFNHNFGFITTALFFSIVMSLFLYWYISQFTKNKLIASMAFIFLSYVLAQYLIVCRPMYFSVIFMGILLVLLIKDSPKMWLLPILFAVWANVHADFTIGLFILGVYFAIKVVSNKNLDKKDALIFTATILSTLINPYGIGLWKTLATELLNPKVGFSSEWRVNTEHVFFVITMVSLLLPAIVIYTKNAQKTWYAIITVFFGGTALVMSYVGRIFMLTGVIAAIIIVNEFLRLKPKTEKILVGVLAFIIIAFSGFVLLKKLNKLDNIEKWSASAGYPYEAVKILRTKDPNANVFNSYAWGGFLIWQLPQYKTFVDGRMTMWKQNNDYIMKDYLAMLVKPAENELLLKTYFKKYNIKYVLIKPELPLAPYLLEQGWTIIYKDKNSILLELKDNFANCIKAVCNV